MVCGDSWMLHGATWIKVLDHRILELFFYEETFTREMFHADFNFKYVRV